MSPSERHALWVFGIFLALLICPRPSVAGPGRWQAHVVYATVAEVYIDAGASSGIRPGDRVVIQRQGKVLAPAEVLDAGRSSARLRVLSAPTEEIQAGDIAVVETSFRTNVEPASPRSEKTDAPFVPLLAPWPGPLPSASAQKNIWHGS